MSLNGRHEIVLKQKHIDTGLRDHCKKCAFALAFEESTGSEVVIKSPHKHNNPQRYVSIYIPGLVWPYYEASPEMVDAILAFDRGDIVQPGVYSYHETLKSRVFTGVKQ